jgi:Ca2+-binding EF-hand superfamily protein
MLSSNLFLFLGNGSVDFDEFLTMMRRRKSTGEYDTELQQVFNVNHID